MCRRPSEAGSSTKNVRPSIQAAGMVKVCPDRNARRRCPLISACFVGFDGCELANCCLVDAIAIALAELGGMSRDNATSVLADVDAG